MRFFFFFFDNFVNLLSYLTLVRKNLLSLKNKMNKVLIVPRKTKLTE